MSLPSKPHTGKARTKIFLLLRQAARHASRARCSGLRFISQNKKPADFD
jgi:hypothetical protein